MAVLEDVMETLLY